MTKQYDYIQCFDCGHIQDELHNRCLDCGSDYIHKIYSELLLSDSRGMYIPRDFYQNFDLEKWNIKKEDYEVLNNPDNDWYWEAWDNLLRNAYYIDEKNQLTYRLEQDGDLFANAIESITEEDFE